MGRISWSVIFLSLLIDTSHARSFPAYNVVLGVWACYCGNHRCPTEPDGRGGDDAGEMDLCGDGDGEACCRASEFKASLRVLSAFSFVATASVFFDVLFCSLWGAEVRKY